MSETEKTCTKDPLSFSDYQIEAKKTDRFPDDESSINNSLLNILEEAGALSRWLRQDLHKHHDQIVKGKVAEGLKINLRSGSSSIFREKAQSKLGDMLWYLTSIATRIDMTIETVARANLDKTLKRWGDEDLKLFDQYVPTKASQGQNEEPKEYPWYEQIPREFVVWFFRDENAKIITFFRVGDARAWMQVGDRIDDNAHEPDNYSFHDVLHFAYAAVLGWSPVTRVLLKRKRKSDPETDRVEDGARAVNLEEALTAFIFEQARANYYFEDVEVRDDIDFRIIKTIERLTSQLEVRRVPVFMWQDAIIQGFKAFRLLRKNDGGYVRASLSERTIEFHKTDPQSND